MTGPGDDMHDDAGDGLYVQNPGINKRDLGDAVFLVNAENESIYHLNAVGAALWRLLAEPTGATQAAADLHTAFPEVPRERIEADVRNLIVDFLTNGLIARHDERSRP